VASVRRWALIAVLAFAGCAQEADEGLPEDGSEGSGSAGDGASVGFRFAPVDATFSCEQGDQTPSTSPSTSSSSPGGTARPESGEQEQDLVPDQSGELCYQLGSGGTSGDVVESAEAENAAGQWQVALVLSESGIDRFNQLAAQCNPPSGACPSGQVAIVLGDEVLSAPTIEQSSFDRDGIVIAGAFTEDEAEEIADLLAG